MKNAIKSLAVFFALFITASAFAQSFNYVDQTQTVTVNANLYTVFQLNLVSGDEITFNFEDFDDYKNGIANTTTTQLTVNSSTDWKLNVKAESANLTYDGNNIPIDNVGVSLATSGTYTVGDANYVNNADGSANAKGLTTSDQTLIEAGTAHNIGDATQNILDLTWYMGTKNGSMRAESMFDQLTRGDFPTGGPYTANVTFTLTQDN
jgi:hypothetical protein